MTASDTTPTAASAGEAVAIVPPHCTGTSLAFDPGVLHVRKDGSGYIAISEDHFSLEDDRGEGPDGPEGSVHWITRLDASEIVALRDFLNGTAQPHPSQQAGTEDCTTQAWADRCVAKRVAGDLFAKADKMKAKGSDRSETIAGLIEDGEALMRLAALNPSEAKG